MIAGRRWTGALQDWLHSRRVRAVLIRPDFYVFGTSADNVEGLIDTLAKALNGSSAASRERAA